jgi:SPP1 gp7 family putative phage head morphogenesis protein
LANALYNLVAVEDAFGLAKITTNTRWKFATAADKMKAFDTWLDGQIKAGVLSEDGNGGNTATGAKYIRSAYRTGIVNTFRKIRKQEQKGKMTPVTGYAGSEDQFLKDTFDASESVQKMQLLGTRVYSALKDVSSTMDAKITRILSQGIADGKNPRELGRQLQKEVSSLGKVRANRIARTEIIHAHAEAQLDAFDALQIEQIQVMAEWSTAGDDKVCPMCNELTGVVLTPKEARGLLPRHPNCRCAWVPADVGESTKGQQRSKAAVQGAINRSVKMEHPKKSMADAFDMSKWAGADLKVDTRPKPIKDLQIFAPSPNLWGQQPTAVMRWMGQDGWSVEDANRVLAEMGEPSNMATIRTQVNAGKKGLRGAPAALTDEQIAILRSKRAGGTIIPPTPPVIKPVVPPPIIQPKPITPPPVKIPGLSKLKKLEDADGTLRSEQLWMVEDQPYSVAGAEFGQKGQIVNLNLKAGPIPLTATQEVMDAARVEAFLKNPNLAIDAGDEALPKIFRYNNRLYIHDGHHRMAAAVLSGEETIAVRYLQDEVTPGSYDLSKYISAAMPKPVVPPVVPPIIPPVLPDIKDIKTTGTSLIRLLGKEGFDFKDARSIADELGLKLSDATLKTQLAAGRKGLRGEVAKLTDVQLTALRARKGTGVITPKPFKLPEPKPIVPKPVVTKSSEPWEYVRREKQLFVGTKEERQKALAKFLKDDPELDALQKKMAGLVDQIEVDIQQKLKTYNEAHAEVSRLELEQRQLARIWKEATPELRWSSMTGKEALAAMRKSPEAGQLKALDKAIAEQKKLLKKLEPETDAIKVQHLRTNPVLNLPEAEQHKMKVQIGWDPKDPEETSGDKTNAGNAKDVAEWIQAKYAKRNDDVLEYKSYIAHGGRSSALPDLDEIRLSANCEPKVIAHEMAHVLEDHSQRAGQEKDIATLFRELRVDRAGTPTKTMNEFMQGAGYHPSETGNEDEFGKFFKYGSSKYYCGKDYTGIYNSKNGTVPTEIISMGVEALYANGPRFARDDPEYFKFIVGFLRGYY